MTGIDTDGQRELAMHVHRYLNEYIRFADAKSTILVGAAAALIAWIIASKSTDTCSLLIRFFALLSSAASYILGMTVITPRLGGAQKGLIFWESILGYDCNEDYVSAFSALCPASLLTTILSHNRELASVAHDKYKTLRQAFLCFSMSLALLLLSLLLDSGT